MVKLTDIVKQIVAESIDAGGYQEEPLSNTLKVDGIEFVVEFTFHTNFGRAIQLVPKQGRETFQIPKTKAQDIAEKVADAINKAQSPQTKITFIPDVYVPQSDNDARIWIAMREEDKHSTQYVYVDDIVKKIANQFK